MLIGTQQQKSVKTINVIFLAAAISFVFWAFPAFSPLDLICALENHASPDCNGYTSEDAARIGINVILYSLHE